MSSRNCCCCWTVHGHPLVPERGTLPAPGMPPSCELRSISLCTCGLWAHMAGARSCSVMVKFWQIACNFYGREIFNSEFQARVVPLVLVPVRLSLLRCYRVLQVLQHREPPYQRLRQLSSPGKQSPWYLVAQGHASGGSFTIRVYRARVVLLWRVKKRSWDPFYDTKAPPRCQTTIPR